MTGDVLMGNPGEMLAPAGILTVAGTDATDGLELERLIARPPAGAG